MTPGGADAASAQHPACHQKNDERRDFDRASPHVSLRARLRVCTRSSPWIVGEGYDSCNRRLRVRRLFCGLRLLIPNPSAADGYTRTNNLKLGLPRINDRPKYCQYDSSLPGGGPALSPVPTLRRLLTPPGIIDIYSGP